MLPRLYKRKLKKCAPVLPDVSFYNIPKGEKYTKQTQTIPNDPKMYQMAVKQTKGP
jgi:hypothetical protein